MGLLGGCLTDVVHIAECGSLAACQPLTRIE